MPKGKMNPFKKEANRINRAIRLVELMIGGSPQFNNKEETALETLIECSKSWVSVLENRSALARVDYTRIKEYKAGDKVTYKGKIQVIK